MQVEATQIMRIRDNIVRMYSMMTGQTQEQITIVRYGVKSTWTVLGSITLYARNDRVENVDVYALAVMTCSFEEDVSYHEVHHISGTFCCG